MLDVIKSIINRKRSFLEAADLILEDMDNDEIMDSLLDDQITSQENDTSFNQNNDSVEDSMVGDENDFKEIDDENKLGPIGADEADDSMMIKDSDEGSPDDELSDIFAISIDTRTNTITDVLPVPPMNAADAMVGDSEAKVDSGFGEESGDLNPMDGFLDETGIYYRDYEYAGHKYLFEGIDDGSGGDAPDMGAGDDVPDAPSPDGESSSDSSNDSSEESEVTTAVKQDLENKEKSEESSEDSSVGDDTDVPDPDNPADSSIDDSSSSGGSSNAEIKDQLKLVNDIDKKVSDLRERLIGKFQ